MDRVCPESAGNLMILCSNPLAQYVSHSKEINSCLRRVLSRGRYILGEEVENFEKEFAGYIGARYGIGVGNGTEALRIALSSCGVGQGDEVITVSFTAVATVAAIELSGAKPVFADIERDFYTLDPAKISALITSRTRAIIPVHLYGQPADLDPILKIARAKKIFVIEDCAQAHGALYKGRRVGSFGDMGCFSFYPTKNLGCIGDGGMIVTNNRKLAEKSFLLREYGWKKRISRIPGYNSRLDELQAAILRIKLRYINSDNRKRNAIAAFYNRQLANTGLILPKIRPSCRHAFHLYAVRSSRRDLLQKALNNNGIGALVHYPLPVHLQPAYKKRIKTGDLRLTGRVAKEELSLPIYPELKISQVKKVCSAIKHFFKGELQ